MNKDFLQNIIVEREFMRELFFADSFPINCFPNIEDDSVLLNGKVVDYILTENGAIHINPNADVLNDMLKFFREFLLKDKFTENELILFIQHLKNEICKQYAKEYGKSFAIDYQTKDFNLLKNSLKTHKGTKLERINYAIFGIGKIAQFIVIYQNTYNKKSLCISQNTRWHQLNNPFLQNYDGIKDIVLDGEVMSADAQKLHGEDIQYDEMQLYHNITIFEPFFEATYAMLQLQKHVLKIMGQRIENAEELSSRKNGREGAKVSNAPYEKIHEEIYRLYLLHTKNKNYYRNRKGLASDIYNDLKEIPSLLEKTLVDDKGKKIIHIIYEEGTVYKQLNDKHLLEFQKKYGDIHGYIPNISSRGAGKNRN